MSVFVCCGVRQYFFCGINRSDTQERIYIAALCGVVWWCGVFFLFAAVALAGMPNGSRWRCLGG